MTHVPRVTVIPLKNGRVTVFLPDGQKACTNCLQRPRALGQRWCQICRTEYNWQRRQGMVEILVTPAERAMLLQWRAERSVVELANHVGGQAARRADC